MKTSVFRMLNSSEGYEKSIFFSPFVLFSDIINFSTSLVRCSLCFPVFLIFSHAITDGMKTHISLQEEHLSFKDVTVIQNVQTISLYLLNMFPTAALLEKNRLQPERAAF